MTISDVSTQTNVTASYQEPVDLEVTAPEVTDQHPEAQPETDGEAPQAAATPISGTGSGSRLPSGTTVDGKPVTKTQLSDGEQATVVREQTRADYGVTSDQVVFTTKGDGDDKVDVSQNSDGSVRVTVNGEEYDVKLGQGQELGLRVGAGNDVVNVAPNVKVNIVVDGGDGDDQITTGAGNDRVDGGAGNDTISGGEGRDDLFGNTGDDTIDGGAGPDVLYGGDGNDKLVGGEGTNYIEGGAGNDHIDGRVGTNMISGGRGDDNIISGGKNNIYTGDGTDTVSDVTTQDKVYAQQGVDAISFVAGQQDNGQVVMNVHIDPSLGQSIKVEGSDAFRQRVEAELDFLRSSANGQQMLAAFDDHAAKGNSLVIKELQDEQNGYASAPAGTLVSQVEIRNGRAASGVDSTINYNTSFHADEFPAPIVVLYHEMSHAYNFTGGTMLPGNYKGPGPDGIPDARGQTVPNAERQAVGLETSAPAFDFDGDPNTAPTTHNPIQLTENGIRRELGLPDRENYTL